MFAVEVGMPEGVFTVAGLSPVVHDIEAGATAARHVVDERRGPHDLGATLAVEGQPTGLPAEGRYTDVRGLLGPTPFWPGVPGSGLVAPRGSFPCL